MLKIYGRKILGGYKFYSGRGSDDCYAIEYSKVIMEFIKNNEISSVVDLGCGDFRVASKIIASCKNYIGVDCVDDLIENHKKKYATDEVHFECLDITRDVLPDGELCLIRQVLQHLSNSEILSVLNKCKKYPYVIVTEHLLNEPTQHPNMDKVRGMHTRLFFGSGVYLGEAPFDFSIQSIYQMPYDKKSHLEMLLIKNKGD
jgi:hypothetical protein